MQKETDYTSKTSNNNFSQNIVILRNTLLNFERLCQQMPELNNLTDICQRLNILLDELTADKVRIVISHLDALGHYLKLVMGTSILTRELQINLELCTRGYYQLVPKPMNQQTNVVLPKKEEINSQSVTITTNDVEHQTELQRRNEQKYLNSLNSFKRSSSYKLVVENKILLFLRDIQRYALGITSSAAVSTKRVFISYAWPIANKYQEEWTTPFIRNLTLHLTYAGICVFLDRHDSGPGHSLPGFMQTVQNIDHVIVVSSRTFAYKMQLDVSGIKYEYTQIQKRLSCDKETNEENFVTILCLNEHNYGQLYFKNAKTVSFYQSEYLETLRNLICRMYGFEQIAFNKFWKNKLVEHKILRNIWRLLPQNHNFVGRESFLQLFSKDDISKKARLVIVGKAGVGKTQLSLQYAYQYGHQYEGVLWFNAENEEQLLQSYKTLALEKGVLNTSQINSMSEQQIVQCVKNWLSGQVNYLLIYDGSDNASYTDEFLPVDNHNIIITTHNSRSFFEYYEGNFSFIEVGNYTDDEAYNYVERTLGNIKNVITPQDIKNLVTAVGLLPRKLVYSCGYILRHRLSINEYIERYTNLPEVLEHYKLTPIQQMVNFRDGTEKLDAGIISHENESKQSTTNNEELKDLIDYLNALEHLFINFLTSNQFNKLNKIFDNIILLILEVLTRNGDYELSLLLIVRHLDAIEFFLNFSYDNHYDDCQQKDMLQLRSLIHKGKILLKQYPLSVPININSLATNNAVYEPCIAINNQDYPDGEQNQFEKQQQFHHLTNPKNPASKVYSELFQKIWLYALNCQKRMSAYLPKKIFISHAYPEDERELENWTTEFIQTLIKHLIAVGIQVYSPGIYPNKACSFNELLSQEHNFDHVLIISSRSREAQLSCIGDTNRVQQEQQEILTYYNNHPELQVQKFFMPILLNHKNHINDKTIAEFAELSFFKEDYLKVLKQLIVAIYGFDFTAFNIYWNRQLVKYELEQKSWHIPAKNEHFTGRLDQLELIKTHFTSGNSEHIVMCACYGLGGVGKTSLVKQFAYVYGYKFAKVFWFNASHREALYADYVQLGEDLGLFSVKEQHLSIELCAMRTKDFLENNEAQGWLAIFDNAPNYDVIHDLLPVKGGQIIVTSRHTQWPGQSINLGVFSPEEAQQYIAKIIGQNAIESEILAEILDRLPLALTYACAYIKYQMISIRDYVKLFPDNKVLDPIATTWDFTIEAIQKELPAANRLLQLCAYLDANNIPAQLLYQDLLLTTTSESLNTFDQVNTRVLFENAIRLCSEYSMLSYDDRDKTISLHHLLQEAIITKMATTGHARQLINETIETVLCYLKPMVENSNYLKGEKIVPHLSQLWLQADKYKNKLNPREEVLYATFLMVIFENFSYYTEHNQRSEYFEEAIKIMSKDKIANLLKLFAGIIYICFQDIDTQEATISKYLSDIHFQQIAESIVNSEGHIGLETLLSLLNKICGKNHRWPAWIGSCLFAIYIAQLNPDGARAYIPYFENLKHKYLGDVHNFIQLLDKLEVMFKFISEPITRVTLKNFLALIQAQDSHAEDKINLIFGLFGEQLHFIHVKSFVDSFKPKITDYITQLLTQLFGDIQDWLHRNKKIELLDKAVNIISKIWSPDHIHLGHLYIKMANCYKDANQLAEAKTYFAKALPILQEFLGEHHPRVIKLLFDLVSSCVYSNLELAKKYCSRAQTSLAQSSQTDIRQNTYVGKVSSLLENNGDKNEIKECCRQIGILMDDLNESRIRVHNTIAFKKHKKPDVAISFSSEGYNISGLFGAENPQKNSTQIIQPDFCAQADATYRK
jgi:hypothetical protein